MPAQVGVKTHGLRELNRALKRAQNVAPKEINLLNERFAQTVVDKAVSRAASLGAAYAKSAESLKAARTAAKAAIRLGGGKYPFAAGFEFGSIRYPQFPGWRGNGSDAGYFLYPTIRQERPRLGDEYLTMVEQLLDDIAKR